MKENREKYEKLIEILSGYESLAVAFSGGVDSTFLLYSAREALCDQVLAVTAKSCSFPERELKEAQDFCAVHSIRHVVVDSEELDIAGFAQNPVNRCYLCKGELFTKIEEIAALEGIKTIAEGSNLDDEGDYRPGLDAVREHGIKSPLREAGLTKADIRALSKALGLPTWDKQAFACLASRFPYGEIINAKKLQMVDQAEQFLLDIGFRQVRVRIHGEKGEQARIELQPEAFSQLIEPKTREALCAAFRRIGFKYISLDLEGYRTGSMNEMLTANSKKC
jgi:uncharacterized protein